MKMYFFIRRLHTKPFKPSLLQLQCKTMTREVFYTQQMLNTPSFTQKR